jgi:hypothetical protein
MMQLSSQKLPYSASRGPVPAKLCLWRGQSDRAPARFVVLLAIFEGAAAELSEDEATSVAHSLTADLRGIREAAARRSFSFGSSYDAGALLAELLLARPELPTRSMKRMTRSPTTPAANVFNRLRESDLS